MWTFRSATACSRDPAPMSSTIIAWPATRLAMSKVQWEAKVNKMRTAYKAPIEIHGTAAITRSATNKAPRYGHTRDMAAIGGTLPIAQAA